MNTTILLFLIAFALFAMQSVGGFLQIKNYQKAARRMHKNGNVGIGQKRGFFTGGYLVLISCDRHGDINAAETMEGITLLAKFKPKKAVLGRDFVGTNIQAFLNDFESLNKKQRKKYKGYIQAIEALDMRLNPEHYETAEEAVSQLQ